MSDPEYRDVEWAVREAVSAAITGTDWAPPEGGILTDVVVIMGFSYADGSHGSAHMICGAPWSGHGLVERTLTRLEATLQNEIADDCEEP